MEMEADLPIEWTDDEKEFGIRLMNHSINNKAKINELIEKFSQNWEISRIATIDKIIITIALTELMDFHEIPVKVSINEAIELSKQYSTEKSSYFINGLLDAAKNHLLDNNLIHKEGKGLLNQSVN
ncbi:MAG: transcription antitermination factor NusB [Ignavibacteria bacterium GWF2_33_9]|nr:MAG: transcription antitermination factor NusB [Ignavibacteria bacterium GWF2_33_9]